MKYIRLITPIISIRFSLHLNNFLIKRPLKFLIKKSNKSAIRFSSQSKPIFGGLSFYFVFLLNMILVFFFLKEDIYLSKEYISLFIIVTLSFLMGLADDVLNTSPIFKFIIQFVCALILIYNDIYIIISPSEWINYCITILWVVGIMNSINMLDNMDGVSSVSSLSIFGAVAFYSFMIASENLQLSLIILVSTIASLLSFLFYNWHPSKMYMGDNGSQFLGILLAWVGIKYFWNAIPITELSYGYNTQQFLIVFLAFLVLISDTTTVSINRLLRKKSPFIGGKDHTTHHLYYLGLSTNWIAFLFFILNSIGLILAFCLIHKGLNISYSYLWIFFLYPILVFLFLYLNTKLTKPK
ncbi:MAG: undecaprenyl/decaprenyl-phosphate alpha-N-acetylglucosaminyl 1-phosphate transferase [Bacteroidales bacterium]|nr:undecaprenyl/decaprenyl-phosphate alpha-N-acetylglucosaminyl 1-phosphate transferase [Bacteroidales bacterium]